MDKLGTFPLTLIEKADSGSIEGYASVFDVIDSQDEVVAPGAFSRSLRALKSSGRPLPLTADHETRADGVIGSAESLKEDKRGLWARFRFAADERSQALRTKARDGHLAGLSIFGRVVQSAERMVDSRPVRVLKEIELMAVGLTPFPANDNALAVAKAVTDSPWDGSASRFTDEQWRRSTILDRGPDAGDTAKQRYAIPVREPNGTINRNGAHAAAAVLAGGRGGVQASSAAKAAAARALVRIYRSDLNEDPPESLLRLAGQAAASIDLDELTDEMTKAVAITHPGARKAAVAALLDAYHDVEAAPEPEGLTAETEKEQTPPVEKNDESANYAVAFLGETGEAGGDPSESSLAESLVTQLNVTKTESEMDLLEKQIREVLGHE